MGVRGEDEAAYKSEHRKKKRLLIKQAIGWWRTEDVSSPPTKQPDGTFSPRTQTLLYTGGALNASFIARDDLNDTA